MGLASLMRLNGNDLALALGGESLWVVRGVNGVIAQYPAYATIQGGRIRAIGEEARKMKGREPDNLKVVRITKCGGFIEPDLGGQATRYFIGKTLPGFSLRLAPRIVVVGPQMSKFSVRDAMMKGGARTVITMPATMAAAIGAGLAIDKPEFQSVFVLERDWCAFAVISLGGFVTSFERVGGVELLLEGVAAHSLATRGVALDLEIMHDMFSTQGLVGSEFPGWEAWLNEIETGRVTIQAINEIDFRRSALPFQCRLDWYHRQSMVSLESAMLRDASGAALHFVGPYAQLPGMADLVAKAFRRTVIVPDNCTETMIRGGQKVLADIKWLMREPKGKK